MNTYTEYLKTKDWKDKRDIKYSKAHKRCAICGESRNLDLHHLNYKDLYSVETTDLRVLCRRCHNISHDLMKNGKIVFSSESHHSRFAVIKYQVKMFLGISNVNMFSNTKVGNNTSVT